MANEMGEWIKDLSSYDYGVKIELNAPMKRADSQIIHIQNNHFRLEMTDKEFASFASYIIKARNELLSYKVGRKDDE